jgi:GntR family transcriptional repressor for pyruvate dehydrogenase complex
MTDTPSFEPISRETVSGQIRFQLLHRMTIGDLAPGSRMPSERVLAEQFAVARTSVREAMQGLVSMGVVERRGNRSYVAEHLPDVQVEQRAAHTSFVADLFETRRLLEVPIFELAAARADDDARANVTELARRFDQDLELDEFRRLDRAFHTTIAASCGNPLLIELYGKVLDRLFRSHEFDSLLRAEQNRPEVERIIARSAAAHRAIAKAFASADSNGCRAEAIHHLDEVEHSMVSDLA